jgi:hypothetical protein
VNAIIIATLDYLKINPANEWLSLLPEIRLGVG